MKEFLCNIDVTELEVNEEITYLIEGWISFDEEVLSCL